MELALALRDRGRAEAAAGELEPIATQYGTHVLRAAAGTARGTVALADGEYDSAIESLRRAWRIWQEMDAPYEVAPSVRIGLHSGEALKTLTGYEGRGVHIAARIGALAGPDEILASRATVEAFGGSTERGPLRTELLRGIAEPVEVAALA